LGDLGGGQVEEAMDDFVDVPLDPRDCGSVAGCGCIPASASSGPKARHMPAQGNALGLHEQAMEP
jgi:hypothetical protein